MRCRRLAGRERPELPEGLAAAGDAAAVPAGEHRRGDAARLDQQVGKAGGEALGLGQRAADGAVARLGAAGLCHR